MSTAERSKKPLTCTQCGATGEATLQVGDEANPQVSVISVTKEFRSLESKTVGTDPGFQCQACGAVVH